MKRQTTAAVKPNWFVQFAKDASIAVGSPVAFFLSVIAVVVWAAMGHAFRYSDTWQLVMNTLSSIVTFLMVFLIQNSQNRDAKALHLKLDEIIRAIQPARNEMIDIENLPDEELERLAAEYERIRVEHERRRRDKEDPAA
jgi:low affinity Fe/Cu permease